MKKVILSILVLMVLAVAIAALQIFVVGTPVDGNTLVIDVDEMENQVNILVTTPASAIAFTDASLRQDGNTLSITFRQVLVSPLYSSGQKSIYLEKDGFTEIYLGGKLIWTTE